MSHKCPHPTCERSVSDTQFACRNHWYRIPKDLRDEIWGAYRSDDWERHAYAMLEARTWLRENP